MFVVNKERGSNRLVFYFQSMLVTVSEQCEKKLLAVKQEEKSGMLTGLSVSRFTTIILQFSQSSHRFYYYFATGEEIYSSY